MNMFIILKALRGLGALAAGTAAAAVLGWGLTLALYRDGEGVTDYERAYRRRDALELGAQWGAGMGFVGALVGLLAAAQGQPPWKAAILAGLPLLPTWAMLMWFLSGALIIAAVSAVLGSLSALVSILVIHRRGAGR